MNRSHFQIEVASNSPKNNVWILAAAIDGVVTLFLIAEICLLTVNACMTANAAVVECLQNRGQLTINADLVDG